MGLFDTIGGLFTGKTKVTTPKLPSLGVSLGGKKPAAQAGSGALTAMLGPIGGAAVNYLAGQYAASKPQPTNTAAQAAQLATKPTQVSSIAPQNAMPGPLANSQGSGNATITAREYVPASTTSPNLPKPPTIFDQADRETNPFYTSLKQGYDNNIAQINSLYEDSVNAYTRPDDDRAYQASILDLNNQRNAASIDADNRYNTNVDDMRAEYADMERAARNADNQMTAAKESDYTKQADKIRQALTSRGVGALEIDRQLRELRDEIFAPVTAQKAQSQSQLAAARTRLNTNMRSLMQANDDQKADIRNKYTSAIVSIQRERGLSDANKQKSVLELRAKLIDDLRATEANFVNQQNLLQTQYNKAEDRGLTAADMIGVLNGMNTVRRDTLNESARKTDMDYAVKQQNLQLAMAKLAKIRGSGGAAVTTAEAADLVAQAQQIQALDPSVTFTKAMDLVANRLRGGPVGAFFGQGIDALLGQKTSDGTIPAKPAGFNNKINGPASNSSALDSLIAGALAKISSK